MSAKRKERKERVTEGEKEVSLKEVEEERIEEVEEDFEEATRESASSMASRSRLNEPLIQLPIISEIPEAVDDFLRNFLQRLGMSRTLNSFEVEWYGSAQKLQTESLRMTSAGICFIPDALTHQQLLHSELKEVHREIDLLREGVLKAGESLVRMQTERDFHRIQYRRLLEEKNRLIEDHKKLRKHLQSFEPALKQLDDKYQAALSQKMLITLEKDRLKNSTSTTLNQEKSQPKRDSRSKSVPVPRKTEFPDPQLAGASTGPCKSSFSLCCSIRAHHLPISCIDLHPRKMILASTSDDRSWRLWALPANGEKVGQMVLTGEGHSDWLSGCSFHPDGAKLATTSGDTTVRLWDFSRGCCVLTLSGHTQPVWCCSFHSFGHSLASCSADKTAKLWDLNTETCCLTMRRHTASVNSVCFLPFSDLVLTSSADKTLAMWDARLGVCITTFQGHHHPCNHATFSLAGNITASCDSHGVINLWDIRKSTSATATVDVGPHPTNQVVFNPTGKMLAVACSDSLVRLVEVDSLVVSSLSGHSDGVQSVTFDHKGETLLSAGSDGLINVWT
ncbi:sperm-associated antigen 16 protein isoform X2 [Halichoeres trimaculatus]|uniref:sperm-associated antigen 16 protein isoform X2 n=1 Tax=Halichoeres trimaculatus TaxID=147232 RepID=UPI003D9F1211